VHELAIAESLVDRVIERTVGRQVVAVTVRVGDAAGVVADALAFSFDVVTVDTPIAGARLVVEEVVGDDLSLVSVELVREESCA
jgi:hydrogenase nickel incorporation protein HypA/HybF